MQKAEPCWLKSKVVDLAVRTGSGQCWMRSQAPWGSVWPGTLVFLFRAFGVKVPAKVPARRLKSGISFGGPSGAPCAGLTPTGYTPYLDTA